MTHTSRGAKVWTPAEKAEAWRLYRSHTSRAIAEIMGRDRADVSEMMRRINCKEEPRPTISDVALCTSDEFRDLVTYRDNQFTLDQSLERVLQGRRA